jgi:hypothetical protein
MQPSSQSCLVLSLKFIPQHAVVSLGPLPRHLTLIVLLPSMLYVCSSVKRTAGVSGGGLDGSVCSACEHNSAHCQALKVGQEQHVNLCGSSEGSGRGAAG